MKQESKKNNKESKSSEEENFAEVDIQSTNKKVKIGFFLLFSVISIICARYSIQDYKMAIIWETEESIFNNALEVCPAR